LDAFKLGDRVEVIESSGGNIAGQQGTVSRVGVRLILVKLDKRPQLPGAVTIIDLSSDDVRIASAFQANELRHVVTPSA
jgi:hypothetical protein